ncbi:hypothetical protein M8009_18635 [Halomonas sp. ATCH28]|uniref:Uncharacterized protein n=1 Tax=Halomonas gemina TaxID=2945105 RepID=A0ABT0T685_9GAMM|nr:hypothetical protein [Halomonas gemina]MCL7942293.1 hypothetical protein [Halomonas gemina]
MTIQRCGEDIGSADEGKEIYCNCGSPDDSREYRSRSELEHTPVDYESTGFGPDGEEIDDGPTSSMSLATLILSNGARIEFSAVEEDSGNHGIAMREIGDVERMMPSVLSMTSRLTALEIYSKLSPNAPIPRLIVAQSDCQPQNALVDIVEEPLEVDLDVLGILPPVVQFGSSSGGGYGGQFCVSGDGWHAFRAFACEGSYPANAWIWCDPSVAYYWRDRWTNGRNRKNSFGITATCGAPAETRHYYKKKVNGKWKRLNTWYLPNHYWQWTRYEGVAKRDRWVRHVSSIQGQPSFVRCFTAIYT